jgi:hypothetical protein
VLDITPLKEAHSNKTNDDENAVIISSETSRIQEQDNPVATSSASLPVDERHVGDNENIALTGVDSHDNNKGTQGEAPDLSDNQNRSTSMVVPVKKPTTPVRRQSSRERKPINKGVLHDITSRVTSSRNTPRKKRRPKRQVIYPSYFVDVARREDQGVIIDLTGDVRNIIYLNIFSYVLVKFYLVRISGIQR